MQAPIRIFAALAKLEDTYGTDAVPTPAANGVQLEESFISELQIEFREQNAREATSQRSFGRSGDARPTGRTANVTLVVALKGVSGAISSGNLPEWHPLHLACGHAAVVDATASSEKVTYSLVSEDHESVTLYLYGARQLYKLVGCRGNVTEEWNAGQLVIARYAMQGLLIADPEGASVPATVAYAQKAVQPPTVVAASLSVSGYTPDDFTEFSFDAGMQIAARPGGNAPDGHAGFAFTDYNPVIRTTIDMPVLATFDPYSLHKNATQFAFSIGRVGSTQYNRLTRAGTKGRLLSTPPGESEGLAMIDLEFRAQLSDAEGLDDATTLVVD